MKTNVLLTSSHVTAADRWFAELDEWTCERGRKLYAGQAVIGLEALEGEEGFAARVLDGEVYRSMLHYDEGEWWGECTCPLRFDCKHCCAAMLHAIATCFDETADEVKPAVKKKAAQPKGEEADSFAAIMADKLGRELSAQEKQCAAAMAELWRMRHQKEMHERLARRVSSMKPQSKGEQEGVVLWPKTPRSPWEAWLYVLHYLREQRLPIIPAFEMATDWQEVNQLVSEWQRQREVEKWRRILESQDRQIQAEPHVRHDLRLRLSKDGVQLEWRRGGIGDFKAMPLTQFLQFANATYGGRLPFADESIALWYAMNTGYGSEPMLDYRKPDATRVLNAVLRRDELAALVVGADGQPMPRVEAPLLWRAETVDDGAVDYHLALVDAQGEPPPPALTVLDGEPSLYITRTAIYAAPPLGGIPGLSAGATVSIPGEVLETPLGVSLLERMRVPLPARMAGRVRTERLRPLLRCELLRNGWGDGEILRIQALAVDEAGNVRERYDAGGWQRTMDEIPAGEGLIFRQERMALAAVPDALGVLKLTWTPHEGGCWQRGVVKKFPELFCDWLQTLPGDVMLELDAVLASLREPAVAARVKLEVESNGIDWFDLQIALDVEDMTLTKAEIRALLDARGGFVRLGDKGWRRIAFMISEEEEAQLADLGLNARDFSAKPQRLHALQLAGKDAAKKLLGEEHSQAIERRVDEIRTRVQPPVPRTVLAELRPYQIEGFHFLAYLSTNRFGGILADDMGLGKTLQTLAWIEWLRASEGMKHPALVVCPKSVTDNWRSEAARFIPGLRVAVLSRGSEAKDVEAVWKESDLVVLNYAQLRILEKALTGLAWGAAVLDEAQAIKNPQSATARAAWALKAEHRLALSGTPIENRLLDLWSILEFAMPGILGNRTTFGKTYDQRTDPLARRRLTARVRPFVLRRTKREVAKDLPARIEEDLLCELEGRQATLYSAELKRARAALLKVNTKAELDAARFSILTSLLRLRQICCHPSLVGAAARRVATTEESEEATVDSAKLASLLDLLEPLMAEGHKVLVFSQFVEMLALIQKEVVERGWRHFLLTGATEDRGALVTDFQATEGGAVFLISLRAGGFGLNLTAASYVVLFDPWWNPAVENQAIDRTHRIGQKNQVIAYRLLVKGSIEEKIRALQKQKSTLASDVLGEESFARALTVDDFKFLLAE